MVAAAHVETALEPVAKRPKTGDTKADILDRDTYFQRMQAARKRINPDGPPIAAMYSSLVDGIVTDPDLMVLPLDDHAIVRGHAVFDTASLCNGCVYRLGIHLDRLFASAENARLTLPFGPTVKENRARMTDIVCRTCVASGRRDASIRFFLSAGPGNFGFTTAGCEPAFYCVVFGSVFGKSVAFELKAFDEATVPVTEVPMKPPILANVKSNNYMLNVLTAMKAGDKGGRFGILVREDGSVAEGCVANAVCITKDGVMLTPEFGDILRGTTVRKAVELAQRHLVGEGRLLKEVRQERVPLSAFQGAAEIFLSGGDTHIFPVKRLDGKPVGNNGENPGPVTSELFRLLEADAKEIAGEHIVLEY